MEYQRPKYAYTPGPEDLGNTGAVSAKMDFKALDDLKHKLDDSEYVEYIFHRLFDNPDVEFVPGKHTSWAYPECWLARYWLYFVKNKHLIENANVLDIGSNLSFYSVWAALNGAKYVFSVEPETVRHRLAMDYVYLRGVNRQVLCCNASADEILDNYHILNRIDYDVVFFMDVFYYLTNGLDVLQKIKDRVNPKYVFFESSVVEDHCNNGHFEFWAADIDPKKMQSYYQGNRAPNIALMPSRNILHSIIKQQGWKIEFYYDYHDFVGHGESPPRRDGQKCFFVLKNPKRLDS